MTAPHDYWRKQILKMSPTLSELACSTVNAHPFVYGLGQKTATGIYLSPPNAVKHLAKKLGGTVQTNVVVMMLCAKTQTEFRGRFAAVFACVPFARVFTG